MLNTQPLGGKAVFLGIIFIIYGVFMTFLSYRHSRITILSTNWIFFFLLIFYISYRIKEPYYDNVGRANLYMVASMLSSWVITIFTDIFTFKHVGYYVSLLVHGISSGLCFSFFLWSLGDGGIIGYQFGSGATTAFVFIFVIVGAFASVVSPFLSMPASSPMIGAYMTMIGVDCFARTGWLIHALDITNATSDAYYHTNQETALEAAFVIVLGVFGCAFQKWQVNATANRIYYDLV